MNIFTKNRLIFYLSLAIIIRLLIMPFFFHPDIKTYHFQASFLKQGVINIYDYLDYHKTELTLKEEFIYFPLTYFFLGGYQSLVSPILGPHFNNWLTNAEQINFSAVAIYRYLFFLKLPYLFVDLLISWVLIKLVSEENVKQKLLLFWLYNPITIFLIYVFSNVDVFPVFFSVLSLLAIKNKKWILAGAMLGIGVGFKAYPLLFLPFLLLSIGKNKDKVKALLGCLGTVFLIILPFIQSTSFRESTLTSGLMSRLLNASVNMGFGESIIIGVVALALLFFSAWYRGVNSSALWKYYLAVLLLVFSFIHFHIQWILWLMPFVGLFAISRFKSYLILKFIILGLLAIPILYQDKFMSFGLLEPISELFLLLPIPFGALQKIYDPYVFQSLIHSLIIAGSMVVIYELLKKEERL